MEKQLYPENYLLSKIEVMVGDLKLPPAIVKGYLNLTPEEIRHALQHGAKANARNEDGETPLMYAKTVEQMRVLKEFNADFSAQDNKKQSVLHHADTPETIGYVVDQPGVDHLVEDRWGMTKKDWLKYALPRARVCSEHRALLVLKKLEALTVFDGRGIC